MDEKTSEEKAMYAAVGNSDQLVSINNHAYNDFRRHSVGTNGADRNRYSDSPKPRRMAIGTNIRTPESNRMAGIEESVSLPQITKADMTNPTNSSRLAVRPRGQDRKDGYNRAFSEIEYGTSAKHAVAHHAYAAGTNQQREGRIMQHHASFCKKQYANQQLLKREITTLRRERMLQGPIVKSSSLPTRELRHGTPSSEHGVDGVRSELRYTRSFLQTKLSETDSSDNGGQSWSTQSEVMLDETQCDHEPDRCKPLITETPLIHTQTHHEEDDSARQLSLKRRQEEEDDDALIKEIVEKREQELEEEIKLQRVSMQALIATSSGGDTTAEEKKPDDTSSVQEPNVPSFGEQKQEHKKRLREQYQELDIKRLESELSREASIQESKETTVDAAHGERREFSLQNIEIVKQRNKGPLEQRPDTKDDHEFDEIVLRHEQMLSDEIENTKKRLKDIMEQENGSMSPPLSGEKATDSLSLGRKSPIRGRFGAQLSETDVQSSECVENDSIECILQQKENQLKHALQNTEVTASGACSALARQAGMDEENEQSMLYRENQSMELKVLLKMRLYKSYEMLDEEKLKIMENSQNPGAGAKTAQAPQAEDRGLCAQMSHNMAAKPNCEQNPEPVDIFNDFASTVQREEHKLFAEVPEGLLCELTEIENVTDDIYGRLAKCSVSDALNIKPLQLSRVQSREGFIEEIQGKSEQIKEFSAVVDNTKAEEVSMQSPASKEFDVLKQLLNELRTGIIFSRTHGDLEESVELFNDIIGRANVCLVDRARDEVILEAQMEEEVLNCDLYVRVLRDIIERESENGNKRLGKIVQILHYCEQFRSSMRKLRDFDQFHQCCKKFESLVLHSEFDIVDSTCAQ